MLASSSTSQLFGLLAHSSAVSRHADSEPPALAANYPDAGYVYLSISPVMPGFVQVAASQEDPLGLKWSLETMSGVTRFHTVFSAWSSDCHALMAQLQSALHSSQIPHHPELFKIPLRFARQVLEDEAKDFASAPKPAARPKGRKTYAFVIAAAALLVASLFLHPFPHHPTAKLAPVYRHSAPQLRM
jgi:hypothetical protein